MAEYSFRITWDTQELNARDWYALGFKVFGHDGAKIPEVFPTGGRQHFAGAFCPTTGRLLGRLRFTELATYVRGARLPIAAVAGVAVDPTATGFGIGALLIEAAAERADNLGCAAMTLVATTPNFYRRHGYETVSHITSWDVPTSAFADLARTPVDGQQRYTTALSSTPDHERKALHDMIIDFLRDVNSQRDWALELDDGPFGLELDDLCGDRLDTMICWSGDQISGVLTYVRSGGYQSNGLVTVEEFLATDHHAVALLLKQLASVAPVAPVTRLRGYTGDLWQHVAGCVGAGVHRADPYMLRVLDPQLAMTSRAAAPGCVGTCRIAIDTGDGREQLVIVWEHGRFSVHPVQGDDAADCVLTPRAWALLYAGQVSASWAVACAGGQIHHEPAAEALAVALSTGPIAQNVAF